MSFQRPLLGEDQAGGVVRLPCRAVYNLPFPACVGFMCLYHQTVFSWGCLTHTDVGDDVVYQAQSLSHPFDSPPSL